MCVTAAAVVGGLATVASAASSIYSASQAGGGGGAGVKPPPYKPLDVAGTQELALKTDVEGYEFSKKDFLDRFPGLVSANEFQTQQAYNNLTTLDPTAQNTFATNALEQSLGSTGGGDPYAAIGGGMGSATNNAAAASLANQTLAKQDYDRQYFDSLLMGNPQKAYGLSGGDVTNLSIANTQGQNQYNQAKYQYQVSKENAGGGGGGL